MTLDVSPKLALQRVLTGAYAHDVLGHALYSDEEYDRYCEIVQENWGKFDHIHKQYVCYRSITTSAKVCVRLKPEDFPSIVKGAAMRAIDDASLFAFMGH